MDALIATDRLVLRFVSAADVEDIQQCIGDPRIYRNVARISAHQTRDETGFRLIIMDELLKRITFMP